MFSRLRHWFCFLLAAVCMSSGLPSLPSAQAKSIGTVQRALLIGVDDFVTYASIYPASTNNVFAMQEALQASSDPFATIMIPPEPVTSTARLTQLIQETFAESQPQDVNYLYISSHGVYCGADATDPALLLSDGKLEDRLTPAALEAAFDGIAGTHILLLDACYSGAFIGKGMHKQPERLYFTGGNFKVLTSSGAMEESWYWNNAQTAADEAHAFPQGAFYFSQALSLSLSPRSGVPADRNRDGSVTLQELYAALVQNHAASTPQVYPEDDTFPVFRYDLAALSDIELSRSPITDVSFTNTTLSAADAQIGLEYIALRPVRVAYQIVHQREGQWRFEEAELVYDSVEQYTAYGDERGAISPGRKVRTLSLPLPPGNAGGYVMVQLVSIENGKLTVHAGRVIVVLPMQADLDLNVETPPSLVQGKHRELPIFIGHSTPCLLSVSIIDAQGNTVRRLTHKQGTRPLGITPNGSVLYWNGTDKLGNPVAPGTFQVQVAGFLGDQRDQALSSPIEILAGDTP